MGAPLDTATLRRLAVAADADPRSVSTRRGAKYVAGRDVVAIAKDVRADLKAAVSSGALPAATYSVRIARYSMGRSIGIVVTDASFPQYNPARLAYEHDGLRREMTDAERCWMSDEARAVDAYLEALLASYNEDCSRPEEDYYCVAFAPNVSIHGDRDAEIAAMLARRAAPVDAQVSFLAFCGVAA